MAALRHPWPDTGELITHPPAALPLRAPLGGAFAFQSGPVILRDRESGSERPEDPWSGISRTVSERSEPTVHDVKESRLDHCALYDAQAYDCRLEQFYRLVFVIVSRSSRFGIREYARRTKPPV